MIMYLNKKYDKIQPEWARFCVFMAIVGPICFILDPKIQIPLLMCLLVFRVPYLVMYLK